MGSIKEAELTEIRRHFPADWDVPEFRIEFWDGKTKDYCVIIPVINEGERIHHFVQHLRENNIDSFADIVIVDGGSTDGSLAHDFLRSHGVRGLLVKLGSGKLSAQLRVGYSFSLFSRFEGIITIDGNNKDDPSAIPGFIILLSQGYDFVQASRFIKGGHHRNTPLIRYLAIRLVHAPVLSIFSGYRWTDTTQGFRAYSQRCLLDPRVQPFRNLFKDYELLAYLSYRIPRIKLKCIEYPVSRVYPRGQVPTKISAFGGNLSLVRTLIRTCLGRFNP
jgi:dolichol-phosphate mannosyltransferase